MIVDAKRDDAGAKEYLDKALKTNFQEPFCGYVIENNEGKTVGAFIFNSFMERNVDISLACEEMLTLRVVRFMARVAFQDLKVKRVTARTRACNPKVIKAILAVGFKYEGRAFDYYDDCDCPDCCFFGMTAKDQKLVRL